MPSLDKSRSLVREAFLNIFQPSWKRVVNLILQYANNNCERKSATVVNGRRPYYRICQRIELIELTWLAKFISRFLLAVTRRGGGQRENIRESLPLLPTTLLLGQERKGGGKERWRGGMKLASRYTANFGRCSPFQRREEGRLLDIAPFHCESFLFYRSFRRISYRRLPVHFPWNFFSSITRV